MRVASKNTKKPQCARHVRGRSVLGHLAFGAWIGYRLSNTGNIGRRHGDSIMRALVKRLAVFAVLLTIVVVAGSWSWQELWRRRHPQRAVAKQLLEDRLGS